jgi:hypothetical protein
MHLTDVEIPDQSLARGDGIALPASEPASLHTLDLAARLTDLPPTALRTDSAANICGGAALLAHYQRLADGAVGARTAAGAWYGAVARYSGATDEGGAARFADDVFSVLRRGAARTTNDGERVRLAGQRAVQPRRAQLDALRLPALAGTATTECPPRLGCRRVRAPYEQYGPTVYDYGNHDRAHRPRDMDIDYIVIHDTEGYWRTALSLVQDPEYVSWHYTLRSSDGQVAQHVRHDDVAWQAGNWYVNMHSIGIEHEGFAAAGARWYTESMYRNSARLVRYLTDKFDIRRDRGHIIGHDQIPGIAPAYVAGMHWDPGPYWNWEHYFRLLDSPIGRSGARTGNRVRVIAPGFGDNRQLLTGCTTGSTAPCRRQGTNFVYLRTRPSSSARLVSDVGLRADGSASTTRVSDIGAKAVAGARFRVVDRAGRWTKVWYLGRAAWFYDPAGDRTSLRSNGKLVTPRPGLASVPVYGRAYPEESAYPPEIPAQEVIPLQYSIRAGQHYVVADADIETDYYYAWTFDDSLPLDHTQVTGQDRYYAIWFGHRMAYVRAADVVLTPAR